MTAYGKLPKFEWAPFEGVYVFRTDSTRWKVAVRMSNPAVPVSLYRMGKLNPGGGYYWRGRHIAHEVCYVVNNVWPPQRGINLRQALRQAADIARANDAAARLVGSDNA